MSVYLFNSKDDRPSFASTVTSSTSSRHGATVLYFIIGVAIFSFPFFIIGKVRFLYQQMFKISEFENTNMEFFVL